MQGPQSYALRPLLRSSGWFAALELYWPGAFLEREAEKYPGKPGDKRVGVCYTALQCA